MRALFSLPALVFAATNAIAQSQPPPIVFLNETVMSEKRALEVADMTRERFWGRVPGYDGKPIQPTSEEERLSIPLPTWDLLHIALSASLAGDAARCKVSSADEHLFRLQNSFRPQYMDEKKVQFAFAYSILIFRDVGARLKDVGCSKERAETLRRGLDFLKAQQDPPVPVFMQPEVMTEKRAEAVIGFTRDELYWDKAKMFDGKTVIAPSNDDERRSIPIPRVDALSLVLYGSMGAEFSRCNLDGQGLVKKLFDPFWGRYQQERQITFGLILMGFASSDVINRRKAVVCTDGEREYLQNTAALLLRPSSNPSK